MHGVTKPLNCVRSSITPQKLPPEGKKTIVQCAWLCPAIHSVCSQSHCRSYSPKERRLLSNLHEEEKPFCAFFNHTTEIVASAIGKVKPLILCVPQSHYRSDSPKERRLSSSVHRVEKPFCAFFNHTTEIVASATGKVKPLILCVPSHTTEVIARRKEDCRPVCTEWKSHFVRSSIT